MRKRHKPLALQRAFSLIEIMVTVTLLSVITVGLLSMFYQTQRAFRLGANQVDILEGGRAVMELISREMQEMFPSHVEGVVNLSAVTQATNYMTDLPGGLVRTNLLQQISFLSRRGDEWMSTTYWVQDHIDVADSVTNAGLGELWRHVVRTNLPTLNQTNFIWGFATNLTRSHSTNDPGAHKIADGVVHFRAYVYNQNGIFYSDSPPNVFIGNSPASVLQPGFDFYDWIPGHVELELGILDPKAVEGFRARGYSLPVAAGYLQGQVHRVHLFKQRVATRARRADFDIFALK
ncbi:MAG: prepilin-type N-terminal cleavage/methylation domain-containing protein [Verrucomicrobia subdivision 3 bacterium]|nr:prepilin-type N-terminal cleavage/methylation domain-containing protein [Limisphaerales bacterium]